MAATETAPPARLKVRYLEEIRPSLMERFGYSSVMQAPKIEKITLNMGVGLAKQDSKMLKAAVDQLATIAGQQPSVRRARKSIAAFKLREGMPVGVSVTLRAERSYEFLDRLVAIAIPRIRDFRGLNPRSFDGRGNYSMGVKEQTIFPEVDYDGIDQVRGLDITITTSATTDTEAYALLSAMGMPFATQGRPAGFDLPGEESAEEEADSTPEPAAAAQVDEAQPETDDADAGAEAPQEEDTAASEEKSGEVEATAEPATETEQDADGAEQEQETAEGASEPSDESAEAASEPGDDVAGESPAPKGDASTSSEGSQESPAQHADSTEKESTD